MHITSEHWSKYFPHKKIRDCQHAAIDFTLNSIINENKRFVIIEAGTGVGKSAIGLTIARYLESHNKGDDLYEGGSYFLTTQKILQEQYVKDFGRHGGIMKSIKSSTNYQCSFYKKNSCAESAQALRTADKDSRFFKSCVFNCNYKAAKEEFLKSKESVTNFPYFLAETAYAGKITPRQTLIIDEAHNVPNELSKFIEIVVTSRFAKQALKLDMPDISTQPQAINWIKNVYSPKLFSHIKHIEKMLEKYAGLKEKLNEFTSIAKQFDLLDKHGCKLSRFMELYDNNNWVCNLIPADGKSGRKIEFKPIDVAPYSEEMLFKLGKKVIMMSATVLDHKALCELLGIGLDDVSFISIPSPFPVKNRPIVVCGLGSMSSKEIDSTLPRMAEGVKKILDNHPTEKGIIHCHTFKIAKYLKNNIRTRRFIIHNSHNREEMLKKHKASKKPTVLLSPSMTEGVDLKDESSRFQVICKIPYPYLGDKLIRKKMNRWKWWYPLNTAKTIMQSVGRSVRSKEDHAVTYILDSGWDRFYRMNKPLFPRGFRECIR